MVAVFAKGFMY